MFGNLNKMLRHMDKEHAGDKVITNFYFIFSLNNASRAGHMDKEHAGDKVISNFYFYFLFK